MDAIDQVLNARNARDLFPNGQDRKAYRGLLRSVHPDRNTDRNDDATRATIYLRELYARANSSSDSSSDLPTFKVRRNTYTATSEWLVSDGARYYKTDNGILSVTDADASWAIEGTQTLSNAIREINDEERNFFLVERAHSKVMQPDGKSLVTVYEPLESGFLTYGQVLDRLHQGVHPKHLAWMFRRLLVALGSLHEHGVTHNSIDEDSVLIHPELHGVVLKDYQFGTEFGEQVTAVSQRALGRLSKRFRETKTPNDGREDLALAAQLMEQGFKDQKVPYWFSGFFNYVKRAQPKDAGALLHEFDEVLDEHWGKRKFVPFHVPGN